MKVLLVEDEPKLGVAIKRGLELDGYTVELVTTAEDALHYTEFETYDIVVLDRMLPGGKDGLDVCATLRQKGWQSPILLLTAMSETSDKVAGLKNGADDYLAKPFAFDELLARMQALLRRPARVVGPKITAGTVQIDMGEKQVTLKGKEVHLTKREYALLEYLAVNKNHVVSKEQIISHVWDFEADVLPNTVEVFIKSLRTKLEDRAGTIIQTERGFGYRMAA